MPALLLPRLPLLQLLTFSTHDLLDPYTFHVEPVTHNMALCIFPALQVVFGPDVLAGNASIITVDKVQLERRGALVGEGSVSGCAGSRQQQSCTCLLLWNVCCTSATRKQPWLGLTLLPGAGPIAQPIRLMLLQTTCRCYMEHLLLQSKC